IIREKRRLSVVVEEKNSLLKARDEEVASLKAQLLVKEAEAVKAICLHVEASRFGVVKKSLRDEVQASADCNTILEKEKCEFDVKVSELAALVKVREQEVADLDAVVTSVKSQNDNLIDQVHRLEASFAGLQEKVTTYENFVDQLEKFQDDKMKEVNEKFDKLSVDFVEMALHLEEEKFQDDKMKEVNENFDKLSADFVKMALHLEEKFYPHLLTTISRRRWLLTNDMELAIAICLNSTEYLSTLGAAIGKAIEKGMHEGLSVGITHGAEGRKLADVAMYNPSAEADYLSALQCLQNDTLAERLGLTESQPHVNQLMVLIHHSPDQRVINASVLSLSLDVSSSRVWKIKENIAHHVSALHGVFVHLAEPLSAMALGGSEGTSGAALDTTTALSMTFVSAGTIPPIS
ncbi:hypothetical protein Tco_1565603, partial [Tanacetum coccineum]